MPCCPVYHYGLFGGTYCLHLQGRRVNQEVGSKQGFPTALKVKAVCTYGTPVNLYPTTPRHIQEDSTVERKVCLHVIFFKLASVIRPSERRHRPTHTQSETGQACCVKSFAVICKEVNKHVSDSELAALCPVPRGPTHFDSSQITSVMQ
jgi:hypothetical protein